MAPESQPRIDLSPMRADDWTDVRAIYLEGIATGDATFERSAPTWEAWDAGHLKPCRLLAREGDRVLGWAALTPVSGRCAYAGVAEVSVYVAERARGRGVGFLLLSELVRASEREGIWTLQAGVFPENQASVAIQRKAGFRLVGTRERLGRLDGRWRDVLLTERRSAVAGV
jgi:phosphinothricin acetyltransferase